MFEEYSRVSICRIVNVSFLIIALILTWASEYRTPLNYIASAIMVPTSLSISVTEKSKGWSIFWMVESILCLVATLLELNR